MTQPTQAMATQRYSTKLDSSQSLDTPRKVNGDAAGARTTSPIAEEDEDGASPAASVNDVNGQGTGSGSDRSSSSGEDDGMPIIKPIAVRRTASQGPPAVVMPTLSGLDKSILRNTKPRAKAISASQPAAKSKKMVQMGAGSESDESSDSSEDEVPASRRGRYATGKGATKKKTKTGGVPRGW